MIYLASPYSDPDPAVQDARFLAACKKAAELMREGKHVFCPIAHSHPIALNGVPGDWEYWEQYDRVFLEMCSEVLVLKLDGWKESRGVQEEIRIAKEMGKPFRFLDGKYI